MRVSPFIRSIFITKKLGNSFDLLGGDYFFIDSFLCVESSKASPNMRNINNAMRT
jgi:hypothetical protein